MNPAALLQRGGQPNVLKVRDGPVHHRHWNTAGLEDDGGLSSPVVCVFFCVDHFLQIAAQEEIQGLIFGECG